MNEEQHESWPLTGIVEPGDHDVLYGRGGGTNRHPGNKRYRAIVEQQITRYTISPRDDKTPLAMDLVHQWRQQTPPGRFLEYDAASAKWNDVGDSRAREKTLQIFRDKCFRTRKTQNRHSFDAGNVGGLGTGEEDHSHGLPDWTNPFHRRFGSEPPRGRWVWSYEEPYPASPFETRGPPLPIAAVYGPPAVVPMSPAHYPVASIPPPVRGPWIVTPVSSPENTRPVRRSFTDVASAWTGQPKHEIEQQLSNEDSDDPPAAFPPPSFPRQSRDVSDPLRVLPIRETSIDTFSMSTARPPLRGLEQRQTTIESLNLDLPPPMVIEMRDRSIEALHLILADDRPQLGRQTSVLSEASVLDALPSRAVVERTTTMELERMEEPLVDGLDYDNITEV